MAGKKKQTYSEAISELETLVARLQQDDCDIDQLKELTTRALELLRFCKKRLFETDEELKKNWNETDL